MERLLSSECVKAYSKSCYAVARSLGRGRVKAVAVAVTKKKTRTEKENSIFSSLIGFIFVFMATCYVY
jgi:hypothetical protein